MCKTKYFLISPLPNGTFINQIWDKAEPKNGSYVKYYNIQEAK